MITVLALLLSCTFVSIHAMEQRNRSNELLVWDASGKNFIDYVSEVQQNKPQTR